MNEGPGRTRQSGLPRLCLASSSPRRAALLRQLGVAFDCHPPQVDERRLPGESARRYLRRITLAKADAGSAQAGGAPVLAADTTVVLDGDVLGKPADAPAGAAMLARLSGRVHHVLTALVVRDAQQIHCALSCSRITFRVITPSEAAAYWRTGEPVDKAGGYAIQGIGAIFVRELRGSYSGVMGLPLYETMQLLARLDDRFTLLAGPQ